MEQINSNKKHSNRRKYFSLLAVVLFIAFSGAYAYWSMELEDMISTDDAYVTGMQINFCTSFRQRHCR